jgi:sialidase-1
MRAQSVSEDGGATWGPLQFAATLVEPVCQGSLLAVGKRQANGKSELLFSNPADRQKRIRMTVRRSMDEGTSWSQGLLLHEGPSAYSCLTDLGRGEAGILYERGSERPYEQLVFSRFAIRDV